MALRRAPKRELKLDDLYGGPGSYRAYVWRRIEKGADVATIAQADELPAKTLYDWTRRWRREAEEAGEPFPLLPRRARRKEKELVDTG